MKPNERNIKKSGFQRLINPKSGNESEEDCDSPAATSRPIVMTSVLPPSCSGSSEIYVIDENPAVRQHSVRRILRDNVKLVMGTIFLTILGTVVIIIGLVHLLITGEIESGLNFLVVGFIPFIPGFYYVVYLLCSISGRPGYQLNQIPGFRS